MNRIAKAVILSIAALAAAATTVEFASAGERNWRKHHSGRHHVVKPWKKRVVVTGVTAGIVAGAVIATRPRVIYRDDPVIVHQDPIYDRETYDREIYDEGTYAAPDEDFDGLAYRDDVPDAEEYATPVYEDGDLETYDEQSRVESQDGYFPERPEPRVEREQKIAAPKKKVIREAAAATELKPWSKEWREWCTGRFSSFNPQNGTYLGYDQKRHFCKAG
ncbi:MAG: BA14K family protein [Rhizobium sp.]|nr:BA14K family protein [Rhizobium sp.]